MSRLNHGDKVEVDLDTRIGWADEKLALNHKVVTIDSFVGYWVDDERRLSSTDDGKSLETYSIVEDGGQFFYPLDNFDMLSREVDKLL